MNQTCQLRSYRPEGLAGLASAPSMRQQSLPEASMSLTCGGSKRGGQFNHTVSQVVVGITDTRGGPI